jgi:hypothetical protein
VLRSPLAAIATIALGTLTVSADAANMTMTFNGLGPNRTIKVSYNAARTWNQAANNGFSNYLSGRMKWTDGIGRNLTTFCTQIKENVSNGQTINFTIAPVANVPDPLPGAMGSIRAAMIQDLYHRHYGSVQGSSNADLNAAFQLAIWEITHENLTGATLAAAKAQLNVGTGAMAAQLSNGVTATVANLATTLIASLGSDGWREWGAGLFGLTHATAQDQLIVVPIPAPVLLAGLGLLGVGVLRRRAR